MNKNRISFLSTASCVVLSLTLPAIAFAATPPDAGQSLQQLQQQPPALPEASPAPLIVQPQAAPHIPGGATVTIEQIVFQGNSVFSRAELLRALGDAEGKSFDLAGLKDLADRITAYYHSAGYPFARALIPAQKNNPGTVTIDIIEGHYGKIAIESDDPRATEAQEFLDALHPGDLIESAPLERASLILNDQPGYRETPIIRPGQDVGTGDLAVDLTRTGRVGGDVGVDNGGDRYTGRLRARADLYANSPFMFGDQVTLSTLYTQEDLWFGALGYNLPIGSSGLRGNVGYAHTYYDLGKDFSALDAHGTADIASAGLSYPLIRSQEENLSLSATYQHKWLHDDQGSISSSTSKSSDSFPLAMNFDLRDSLLNGGITYGTVSWTHGVLDLDNALKNVDSITANTDGQFDKFNLDIARLQSLPEGFALFGRFSGQLAEDNLDSSERFGLGGPNGVRAYPTGEGFGDEGFIGQIELRYPIDAFTPYTFYDTGHVKTNEDPFAAGTNTRTISGAGFGTRFAFENWTADASLAWRTQGGDPQSDTKHDTPLFWASVGYKF